METLDFEAMAKDAKKALKKIGLQIEDYVKVAGLPVGYMQFIEIAREIDKTESVCWCLTSRRQFSRSQRRTVFWR